MAEKTTTRDNLMNEKGYSPYCGAAFMRVCSMPRTRYINGQFECPDCGWVSEFPKEFIERYKEKWGLE